jgi:hypothetical protein
MVLISGIEFAIFLVVENDETIILLPVYLPCWLQR